MVQTGKERRSHQGHGRVRVDMELESPPQMSVAHLEPDALMP